MKNGKSARLLPAHAASYVFKCFLYDLLCRFILHPVQALERGICPVFTNQSQCPCSLEPDAGIIIPEGADEFIHRCRVSHSPQRFRSLPATDFIVIGEQADKVLALKAKDKENEQRDIKLDDINGDGAIDLIINESGGNMEKGMKSKTSSISKRTRQ